MALSPSHRSSNGYGYAGGGSPGGPPADRRYSVQSLRSAARDEVAQVTQSSPVDILLNRIQEANQQVQTEYTARRYDRAFVEWLKSDAVLAMLPNHTDFPYLRTDRKERYMKCRKDHEAQRAIYDELEAIVEGRGSRHSSVSLSSRPSSASNSTPSAPNGAPSSDPLLTRFSQLRVSSGSGPKLPYPTTDHSLRFPGQDAGAASNGLPRPDTGERPMGPRQMPPPLYSPPPPPKQPLPAVATSLPQAPAPVYSPSKDIGPTSKAAPQKAAPPPPPPPRKDPSSAPRPLQMPKPQPFQYGGEPPKLPQRKTPSPLPPEVPKPPLPQGSTITAEKLFHVFKSGYQILVIDVRSRELFDEGHIHAKTIVCIDPLTLKYGMSFDQLIESLVLSPDPELDLLETIGRFDLVVYYDEMTANEKFLRGAPTSAQQPGLRALHDTLVEFNDQSPLLRSPMLLIGGLNAWMDLVGPNALQTSTTLGYPRSRRLPKPARPPVRRISITDNNSSREIRKRRLARHRPLNEEEERAWIERLKEERIAEATPAEEAESGAAPRDDPSVDMIHTYDDFFRRFPSVEQQSMTTPRPPKPPARPAPAAPAIPVMPSRPAPAVSRPSYGGVSDRETSQNSLSRQSSASQQPPLYISRSVPQALRLPRTGLKNFSNTCYMNATIQCLQATTPLLAFFLNDGFHHSVQKNPRGSDGILPNIFANLLRGLWRNTDPVVRPVTLQKFGGRLREDWANVGVQQDAMEYLHFLIDTLHEDLNVNFQRSVLRELTDKEEQVREKMVLAQASKIEWDRWSHRESSAISHFFFGQYASRLTCTTCRQTSTRYEPFTSLAIELPAKGYTTLAECLRNYCKEEMLDPGEEWMCPRCGVRRQATKQLVITRVPQILTLHLKRFAHVDRAAQKIQTVVDFPLHGLDAGAIVGNTARRDDANPGHPDWAVTPPFTFDAFAVMRHHGNTLMSGHYTAVVKDKVRNTWVNFNDERVSEVDPARLSQQQRLQNSEAYILFYERVRPR